MSIHFNLRRSHSQTCFQQQLPRITTNKTDEEYDYFRDTLSTRSQAKSNEKMAPYPVIATELAITILQDERFPAKDELIYLKRGFIDITKLYDKFQSLPEPERQAKTYWLKTLVYLIANKQIKAKETLETAANSGVFQAKINLVGYYLFVSTNNLENSVICNFLAEGISKNDHFANYLQGYRLFNGIGIEKNFDEAFEYFKTASSLGSLEGTYQMAICHYYGRGTAINYKKAIKLSKELIQLQFHQARLLLADALMTGNGVKKNIEEGLIMYKKAAHFGITKAMLDLASYYTEGIDGISKNISLAVKYYEKLAKLGEPEGIFWLSEILLTKKEFNTVEYRDKGMKLLRKAANLGHEEAIYRLYYKEKPLRSNRNMPNKTKSDLEADVISSINFEERIEKVMHKADSRMRSICTDHIYRRIESINLGSEESEFDLIDASSKNIKAESKDVQKEISAYKMIDQLVKDISNNEKHLRYAEDAARRNSLAAIRLLILYYAAKDPAKTFQLYIDGATSYADSECMYQLSQCYLIGNGTKKNYSNAIHWLNQAANHGHHQACLFLESIGHA